MITRQFISELSTKYQTSEQNVAREYCQHLFLSYLNKKQSSRYLLFKGGTALRIVFQSPRFSEDLDFSAFNVNAQEINTIVDDVLKDLANEGIVSDKTVNPGTDGETSGGYYSVANLKLMDFDSEIRIQVSLRTASNLQSSSTLIENDFIPAYTINYLFEQMLVGEKIRALLERAKPRDFFDLYFILRHRELVKFLPRDIVELKAKLLKLIESDGWEKELKLFLPTSYHTLIKDFPERLSREVETHVS